MSWKDTIKEDEPVKVASNWRNTIAEASLAPEAGLIQDTLSAIDSVSGAPTRAALNAVIDLENPISAFASQFAEDPELAPTGKDIAKKIGVTEKSYKEIAPLAFEDGRVWDGIKSASGAISPVLPFVADKVRDFVGDTSPAGTAGLAVDVGADWTNLVGTGLLKGGARVADETLALARLGTKSAVKAGAKATGKAAAAATDIATGSRTGTEALKSVENLLSPKVAEDFDRMVDIAKRNEIDPSLLPASVEFGPNSVLSRGERSVAEGPTGEALLNRHGTALEQVRKAVDKRFKDTGGGRLMDEIEAGQHLRDSFDRGVDRFFSGIDWTHNGVVKTLDDMGMADIPVRLKDQNKIANKLDEIEEFALKELDANFSPAEKPAYEGLLNAVNAVRSRDGSYKELLDVQRRIGRVAFAPGKPGIPAPDKKKLADLYFALDETLINSTEKALGKEVANSLKQNNRLMSDFFGQKGVLTPIVEDLKQAPEKVFQSLVKNGDSRKIKALKQVLPPEDVQALKGAFLESLVKRDADGGFSVDRLRSALQSKKFVAKSLFEPQELAEINDLLELAERMGSPILSSSGTGASNSFRELVKGVADSVSSRVVLDNMRDSARAVKNPRETLSIPLIGPIPSAVTPGTPLLANSSLITSPAATVTESILKGAPKPAALSTTEQVNSDRDAESAQAGYLGTMTPMRTPPETIIQKAKRLNQMNQGM